jgi:hypothetical protein
VGVERQCAAEIWVFFAMSQLGERRGGRGSVERPSSRVCERAGLRAKERQVVVARRQDCREESAGALLWGERGHRAGS